MRKLKRPGAVMGLFVLGVEATGVASGAYVYGARAGSDEALQVDRAAGAHRPRRPGGDTPGRRALPEGAVSGPVHRPPLAEGAGHEVGAGDVA